MGAAHTQKNYHSVLAKRNPIYLGNDGDATNLLHPWVVRGRHAVEVPCDLGPQIRHRDELKRAPRAGVGWVSGWVGHT